MPVKKYIYYSIIRFLNQNLVQTLYISINFDPFTYKVVNLIHIKNYVQNEVKYWFLPNVVENLGYFYKERVNGHPKRIHIPKTYSNSFTK